MDGQGGVGGLVEEVIAKVHFCGMKSMLLWLAPDLGKGLATRSSFGLGGAFRIHLDEIGGVILLAAGEVRPVPRPDL